MDISLLSREKAFDVKYYKTGIIRKKRGNKYVYYYVKNNKPVSKKDMTRINKIKIPPVWNNVWISSNPTTPIQAIGFDAKGIKQYIYTKFHIKKAEEKKFLKMYDFIKAIPKLERAIQRHSKLDTYDKKKVISTMLIIIRKLYMRTGKEVYARRNKSYGVTSLRKIHMKIESDKIKFRFKGKSKKRLSYTFNNKKIAKHLKLLLRLEGNKLFQYIDTKTNKVRGITDVDLNQYIQHYMGHRFTIKDFRTYAANKYFIDSLIKETLKRTPKNQKAIKKNIINAIKSVVFYMRHTRAVSKKSYILNFAIDLYKNNPEYFIKRKLDDPDDTLLDIFKMYKKKILKI